MMPGTWAWAIVASAMVRAVVAMMILVFIFVFPFWLIGAQPGSVHQAVNVGLLFVRCSFRLRSMIVDSWNQHDAAMARDSGRGAHERSVVAVISEIMVIGLLLASFRP